MLQQPIILFVCEHGAAKSIVAAAYFNKLARERKLNLHAIARGTTPDEELSPKAVGGLRRDGLSPGESHPRKLSLADVETAQRVVAFCDLPEEYQSKAAVERWDDILSVSEDYEKARDTILEKLRQLMNSL